MPKDPRDMIGQNPTGRERKSSAGKRRQVAAKAERERKAEPTMDDYATASRIITSLIPGVRR